MDIDRFHPVKMGIDGKNIDSFLDILVLKMRAHNASYNNIYSDLSLIFLPNIPILVRT